MHDLAVDMKRAHRSKTAKMHLDQSTRSSERTSIIKPAQEASLATIRDSDIERSEL